jgi:hypothetical protein
VSIPPNFPVNLLFPPANAKRAGACRECEETTSVKFVSQLSRELIKRGQDRIPAPLQDLFEMCEDNIEFSSTVTITFPLTPSRRHYLTDEHAKDAQDLHARIDTVRDSLVQIQNGSDFGIEIQHRVVVREFDDTGSLISEENV